MSDARLQCGRFQLSLNRPLVMGVVNVTPDSFSDGGRYAETGSACAHAEALLAEGADLLDIGGESTRPGAMPVGVQQELDRVIPVLEQLRGCGVPLSVDTRKPEVMRAAVAAGAAMINDITALSQPDALGAVQASTVGVCLMHMQGEPGSMQQRPEYRDVVAEVTAYLLERAQCAIQAGVASQRLLLDPGFGFGKSQAHNVALFRAIPSLVALGYPVLVGVSRKSMIGAITGRTVPEQRVAGSLAAALLAMQAGAAMVRVHDVAATVDARAVWEAMKEHGS